MVGPAGGATFRGEPMLLRKLQVAKKEAARSPADVPVSASEPTHGERRVRVRTREALPAAGSSSSSVTGSTVVGLA